MPFVSNLSLPLRGDTFTLDEGQAGHQTPKEVVIPGCFHGVLLMGSFCASRRHSCLGPAERVDDLLNRKLVLSLLLLVLGLHSLIQLHEGGGGPAWTSPLDWGHGITPSIGCLIATAATAAFTPVHNWTRVHILYKSFFQEKDLPSNRLNGGGNQAPAY